MCVGGRLKNAIISENARHPVILPARHHVATLIVRECHAVSGHMGQEYVLAALRQRFWIVCGRREVKRVIKDCMICKRRRATKCEQMMADLPSTRVAGSYPPFTHVGVDYFGPFEVNMARSTVKRYGCLFTRMACRVIHIEVAHSLDTNAFINALQRFIARRGKPVSITSDNDTNFIGANRELREAITSWNQSNIDTFLNQREIQWHFNPPHASHMGGVWERLIRTIRKSCHR